MWGWISGFSGWGEGSQGVCMSSTMRAAVLHGREDVRIEDVPLRGLEEGEVRLRIEAALTCGTDLKVYRRGYHAKMIVPPAVFGHEMAGVIEEVSPGVNGWATGDRVVVANSAPCGECEFCDWGQENLCARLMFLNGAYAESMVVPRRLVERNLLRLKPGTAFRDAALTEPLACVVQGLDDCRVQPGQRVLVLGAGPIGLMFVRLASVLGCRVWVAGRGESRLAAARRLGAERVLAVASGVSAEDVVRGSGLGLADVVIEAVGRPEVWEAAVRLVRRGGVVNFFGGCSAGATVTLDTGLLHYSNLVLVASFHHTPRTIRRALGHIESGLVRAEDFVDGECGLEDLPGLLKSMAAGNRAIKTLVRVRGVRG
jgi:L-iditol 2-dehydrogenase